LKTLSEQKSRRARPGVGVGKKKRYEGKGYLLGERKKGRESAHYPRGQWGDKAEKRGKEGGKLNKEGQCQGGGEEVV